MEESLRPMDQAKVDRLVLADAIIRWRRLKNATQDHTLSCACVDCSNRRKIGATIDMPYAGPVLETNCSLRR